MGGDRSCTHLGGSRSHHVLHSSATEACSCLSTVSSSRAQARDSVSCRNSCRPSRGSFRKRSRAADAVRTAGAPLGRLSPLHPGAPPMGCGCVPLCATPGGPAVPGRAMGRAIAKGAPWRARCPACVPAGPPSAAACMLHAQAHLLLCTLRPVYAMAVSTRSPSRM